MSIRPAILLGFAIAGAITYRALLYNPEIIKVPQVSSVSLSEVAGAISDNSKNKNTDDKTDSSEKNSESSPIENKTSEVIGKATEEIGGAVMGAANKYTDGLVSSSVDKVEELVIETAAEQAIKQIKKLPEKDQTIIKDAICN